MIKNQVNPVDMGALCRSSGSVLKMETFECFAKERVLQDVSHHQHDAHANAYSEAKFLGIVALGQWPLIVRVLVFLTSAERIFYFVESILPVLRAKDCSRQMSRFPEAPGKRKLSDRVMNFVLNLPH